MLDNRNFMMANLFGMMGASQSAKYAYAKIMIAP